ncbi:MAG: peptidoglycan DD-metalloendopeptidase family protein [Clostridia bacterium]
MYRRWVVLSVLLLSLSLFCVPASAQEMVSAVAAEYEPWGAWQAQPIPAQPNLETERASRVLSVDHFTWTYRRYVYYNTQHDAWFASATEQQGAHVRADSGYWEETTRDAALGQVGEDAGAILYEDYWFNERVDVTQETKEQMMYRSRVVRKVTCEVSSSELLLFPGKTRGLKVNFFDGDAPITWRSADPAIATVDQSGQVSGVLYGATQVTASSAKGREVTIEVLVCEQSAQIPEGLYTFRLSKTGKTLTVGRTLTSKSDNLVVRDFTGERDQRFIVAAASNKTFTIHPMTAKKRFVDIARGRGGLKAGANVQTHAVKDRMSQYFRAVRVPDGSYILYARADASLVVGAEPLEAGDNVRMEAVAELEQLDRWVPIRIGKSSEPDAPFARPVARNGASYVAKDFGGVGNPAQHGIDFSAGGKRVFVLASARGTVLSVSDDCAHDYPKTANAAGELIDPCGASATALGKYAVIDHGGGITCVYAHLSEIYVKIGDTVRQGAMIGRSGATGSIDGVGFSFEMRQDGVPVDPRTQIKLPEAGQPIE